LAGGTVRVVVFNGGVVVPGGLVGPGFVLVGGGVGVVSTKVTVVLSVCPSKM
jgi:hypothetical protein